MYLVIDKGEILFALCQYNEFIMIEINYTHYFASIVIGNSSRAYRSLRLVFIFCFFSVYYCLQKRKQRLFMTTQQKPTTVSPTHWQQFAMEKYKPNYWKESIPSFSKR